MLGRSSGRIRSSVRRAGMRRRLVMRTKVAIGILAPRRREPDETVLDDDAAPSCDVQCPKEVHPRQAADLDRQLNVEVVAQHGQRADELGCAAAVPIHPRTVVRE